MGFCWCTIKVKDMEESLDFYMDIVGLQVERRLKTGPDREIVFLDGGETKIELISGKDSDVNIGNDISIGFTVDSIDRKMEFLQGRGIEVLEGPFRPNPSIAFFYISDPGGLKIQFVEIL